MSMSEIQEAAEVITSAVSPDANIIFGASVRPELDDEIIITVIATGFDSEYYHEPRKEQQQPIHTEVEKPADVDSTAVEEVDMNLDSEVEDVDNQRSSFVSEGDGNIWDNIKTDDDESDIPAILRRKRKEDNE
jgi:cell division protein FtsZ